MQTLEMRTRYRMQQWTQIIQDCRNSGQRVVHWCSEHNVNVKSYYYWLRKIREATIQSSPMITSPDVTNSSTLVPIPATLHKSASRSETIQQHPSIVLRTDAMTIEIHPHASHELLEQTLRILNHVR